MERIQSPYNAPKTSEAFEKKENSSVIEYIQSVIDSIDEKFLRSVTERDFRRATGYTDAMRTFIPLKNIKVREDVENNTLGSYKDNEIEIFSANINSSATASAQEYRKSQVVDVKTSPEEYPLEKKFTSIKTLFTVVHEELHALTDSGWTVATETKSRISTHAPTYYKKTIGFNIYKATSRRSDGKQKMLTDCHNTGINEGVTQLFSLRITRAYLTQNLPQEISIGEVNFMLQENNIGYRREIWATEQYIALISTLSDIPEDVILDSLFRSYLRNEDYLPSSFTELLHENTSRLSADVIKELTECFSSALSTNIFKQDSLFYDIFYTLIDVLSPEKQELIRKKLTFLNIKYEGPLPE